MVQAPTDGNTMVHWLLGLGYCIQDFRCFLWMIVNFFLKDSLHVDPSTLQMLQNTANLPMVGKSLYGIISDAVYINGEHRIPYIAFGAFLQAISWILVAILSSKGISIFRTTLYLLLGNLGASIAEVANDAIVAEMGKRFKKWTVIAIRRAAIICLDGFLVGRSSRKLACWDSYCKILTPSFVPCVWPNCCCPVLHNYYSAGKESPSSQESI